MAIEDRLSGASEAWRPTDPKEFPDHPNPLVGIITEIDEVEGDYGVYPLIYVSDDAGNEWRWSVFGSVAQKRVAQLKPEIGDKIGVKFLGELPAKNFPGKNYRNWKIVVEKASGEKPAGPDWDALEKAADDPANEAF